MGRVSRRFDLLDGPNDGSLVSCGQGRLGALLRIRFQKNALKSNPKIEEISKKDLEDGLRAATKETQKGDYYRNKTSHGARLLETIDPDLVQKAAPNYKKLFEAVLAKLG